MSNPLHQGQVLLEIKDLSCKIGQQNILSNIRFSCLKGDIVGVIGPNGSGKTTLMECIAGLRPQHSGIVDVSGKAIDQRDRHKHFFYQPDQILPYPDHAVFATLNFFRQMMNVSQVRLRNVIDRLKLEPVLNKSAKDLSRGYQKRLLIAIALLSKNDILMLDEPFEGLDIRQTKEVVSILKDEKELGKTLILSIHQIADAQRIADNFLLLSSGKLLGYGDLGMLQTVAGLKDGTLEDVFVALT
ncbi:MAG: ABC transporter ATP-binding protein [Leptolyngbya sp.]|nr:ABC transporter ATP-binding protein [Candidatus Melainabacteria bacterium]